MTPAFKAAVLAIWTHEDFRGTREDARRIALKGLAQPADMFSDLLSAQATATEEIEPDHPGQLYLLGE